MQITALHHAVNYELSRKAEHMTDMLLSRGGRGLMAAKTVRIATLC